MEESQEHDSMVDRSDTRHATPVETPEVTEQCSEEETQAVNDCVARYLENQDCENNGSDDDVPFYSVDQLPNQKLIEGCGCANDCFNKFPSKDIKDHIWLIRGLEKSERELQIMTVLEGVGTESSKTRRGSRKRMIYQYHYKSQKVCRNAFMVLYDIHDFTLRALISHMNENGVTPRVHARKGKRARHALSFDDVKRVVMFLQSYAAEHGMTQPAAPHGRLAIQPIFLRSSLNKAAVHKIYIASLADQDVRIVKLSAFKKIWQSCVPYIQVASSRMDVSEMCETQPRAIMDAVANQGKNAAAENMYMYVL